MKSSKAVAPIPSTKVDAGEGGTFSVPVSDLLDSEMREPELPSGWVRPPVASADATVSLDLPDKIGPEDLEGIFTKLIGAVPQTVGHDTRERLRERLVIQAIYRMVEAVKNYTPENAWDRQTPYDKELERIINARLKASGATGKARVQKNSPLETRIARCIFFDKRRAHNASQTIRAAIEKGKSPDELLKFIEESGGTEAIRRKAPTSAGEDVVRRMWETKPLLTITTLPNEIVGEQKSDLPKCMLCTVRQTGEVDVRWIGDSPAAARSALQEFAKQSVNSVVTPDTSSTQQDRKSVV